MARKPAKSVAADSLSHQTIAEHIAAFRKRGGKIEVLGTTPLRATTSTFRSSTKSQRKGPKT